MLNNIKLFTVFLVSIFCIQLKADENLLGYVRGAETLPQGSWELYQVVTSRNDKGKGTYNAIDAETELEYGYTDRFSVIGGILLQSINTSGLVIDGYLPKDEEYGVKLSGVELALKYNFLSPAKDDIGLSTYLSLEYTALDPHSGQEKDTTSVKLLALVQKYFLEGEMIWATNVGMETTYAHRKEISEDQLPADFDWPEDPEMEIEFIAGTGLSYRFLPNWFFGGETLFETEYETEIGQERWTVFAGPSLHYGGEKWWTTLTYFPQIQGGREKYPDQTDDKLHLVEKTKYEAKIKVGFNF